MPDLARYGLLCLVVLITNYQEGVTGFGCTALALPFAIMLFGLDVAKPTLVILALVLNLGNVLLSRKKIVWREYFIIIVLAGLGLPFGMWIAEALPERALKLVLAVFMAGIGVHGVATLGRASGGKMSKRVRMLVSGFLPIGGAIHGAFGSGGPLVVVYATRVLGDKSVFRVTLSLVWLTLNTILIASWATQGVMRAEHLRLAAICLPFTLTGLFIGNHAHRRIDELAFKRMVYWVLCASGIALAWSALAR